jgi:phage/plasmid-associated DNA primase
MSQPDVIARFIKERCIIANPSEFPPTCEEPTALFRAYQAYCEEAGEVPLTRHNFMFNILRNFDVTVYRAPGTTSYTLLKGIALKGDDDEDDAA